MPLVAELGQDDEDPVGLLPLELDELRLLLLAGVALPAGRRGLTDLDHDAPVSYLGLEIAADDLADRALAQLGPLLGERVGQLVRSDEVAGRRCGADPGGTCRPRPHGRTDRKQCCEHDQDPAQHPPPDTWPAMLRAVWSRAGRCVVLGRPAPYATPCALRGCNASLRMSELRAPYPDSVTTKRNGPDHKEKRPLGEGRFSGMKLGGGWVPQRSASYAWRSSPVRGILFTPTRACRRAKALRPRSGRL